MSVAPGAFQGRKLTVSDRRASEKFNAGDELVNDNPVENWQTADSPRSEKTLPVLKSYGARLVTPPGS
jgi:hypothetical protein